MCHILYADATQLYVSMENHSNMEICCGELHAYICTKHNMHCNWLLS